jgi:hypothetical protein
MMAMPLFLLDREVESRSRTGLRIESPPMAIDTGMKTFHEWLTDRTAKNEGLWLNDKSAVVGLSNINPLLQKKAKVKPLKLPKATLGVAGATPKPFKAMVPAAFKRKLGAVPQNQIVRSGTSNAVVGQAVSGV